MCSVAISACLCVQCLCLCLSICICMVVYCCMHTRQKRLGRFRVTGVRHYIRPLVLGEGTGSPKQPAPRTGGDTNRKAKKEVQRRKFSHPDESHRTKEKARGQSTCQSYGVDHPKTGESRRRGKLQAEKAKHLQEEGRKESHKKSLNHPPTHKPTLHTLKGWILPGILLYTVVIYGITPYIASYIAIIWI